MYAVSSLMKNVRGQNENSSGGCLQSTQTRLLAMCILDVMGGLYALASANRLHLISTALKVTGYIFIFLVIVGFGVTALGAYGVVQREAYFVKIFLYWSVFSLVFNFILSLIDLNSIDKQCEYIWHNFDHSAYRNHQDLFLKQCASYAFIFFSFIMVASALMRLYYTWLIRTFYIQVNGEAHSSFPSYGYQGLRNDGTTVADSARDQEEEVGLNKHAEDV